MDPILAPGPRLEPIVSPTGSPVPVTLLTGFLGAGKTTLLNRILNGDHGLKVGVLVNDFGAVDIDGRLIDGVAENTITLSNGCVCCEVRDDLISSFEDLLAGNPHLDYVILEASGIADPESIVMTFSDTKYEELLRLDSVTCVVDAEAVFVHRENVELVMLKLRQIGFADLVVVNKVDLVPAEALDLIREWIGRHLRRVRIVEAERCDVPYEVLLSVGRFDPSILEGQGAGLHEHGPGFETWHYTTNEAVSVSRLWEAIRALPASIYRCKGIVQTAEKPDERSLVQAVGRRCNLASLGPWPDGSRHGDIVVIGAPGAIDAAQLKAAFDACIAEPAQGKPRTQG